MECEESDIIVNFKTGRCSFPFPSPVGRRARDEGNSSFPQVQQPNFFAHVNPDTFLAGFNLTAEEVQSEGEPVDSDPDAGWFFILEERAGDLRFGADVPESETGLNTTSSGNTIKVGTVNSGWDDLNWGHIADSMGKDKLEDLSYIGVIDSNMDNELESRNNSDPEWGLNSANLAYILFQSHVKVAIHADQMIK